MNDALDKLECWFGTSLYFVKINIQRAVENHCLYDMKIVFSAITVLRMIYALYNIMKL